MLPAGRNVTGAPSNRIRYLIVALLDATVTALISKPTLGTPAGGFNDEASGIAGPNPETIPGVGTSFAVFTG